MSSTPTSTQPRPQLPASASSTAIPPSKPPVTIPPSSHLDTGTYVRGSHPITIGANVVIHPRAHLCSQHAPLVIGDDCIVSEKCVLGGPIVSSSSLSVAAATSGAGAGVAGQRQTRIGSSVHLHPGCAVEAGSTVGSFAVVEPNASVGAGCSVGSHGKVCAGAGLLSGSVVGDWTVVYGNGNQRRRRQRQKRRPALSDRSDAVDEEDREEDVDEAEKARIVAMQKEREGSLMILKSNALKMLSASGARKK